MKNKIKKITRSVLTLFLMVLIGVSLAFAATDVRDTPNDGGKTAAVLNKSNNLSYTARDMAKYNNLYCVCHSRAMDSSLVDKTNIRLIATAMVEISGNNAKFYKVSTDGTETYVGETNVSQNNIMAGIISAESPKTVQGGNETFNVYKGYGGLKKVRDTWPMFEPDYTITQVAIHKYYNTWRSSIPTNINPGFEADTVDWTNINDNKEKAADEYIKQIKASNETYSAKMYFLKLKCNEIDGWAPYQNTILVEAISKLDIPVQKVWEDNNDKKGIRPDEIEIQLFKNGKKVDSLKLNDKNKWKGEFKDLEKKDEDGKDIKYEIKEINVTGYDTNITGSQTTGFTITNTLKTTKISLTKVWKDNNNEDKVRPDAIQVDLYADDQFTNKSAILNEENQWKYTFEDLELYNKNKKEIKYTIKEKGIPEEYISVITGDMTKGFIITNSQETVEFKVLKIWEDNNNQDGIRPKEIEVQLLADGKEKGDIIKLNDNNNWMHIFKALPEKNKEGQQIKYTVKEINLKEEYVSVITGDMTKGYIITNTQETIELKITKIWDDEDDADGIRPKEIKVQLYADGKETDKEVILNNENNWTYTFKTLPEKNSEGKQIKYTIKEIDLPEGYISVIEGDMEQGFVIKNTHEVELDGYVEITGTVWHDEIDDHKANTKNGVLDENDTKMGGIKLVLKDAQGNPMNCTYTDEQGEFTRTDYGITQKDGTYKIRVNYDNSKKVYKLFEDVNKVEEKLKTAYVEFEYDANKYTTVKTGTSGENTSKAKENATIRKEFDNEYGTVTPTTDINTINAEKITARTQGVISFEKYEDIENTERKETVKYCNGDGTHIKTNFKGAWLEIQEAKNDELNHEENCSEKPHVLKEQDIDVKIIKNVNLGLSDREQPDVAIFSDISKVKVTMKGQQYTYIYNVRSNEKNNVGLKAKFQEKDTYIYKRPVNPADIAYVNKVDNNAMSVEVTYEVTLANLSTTLPVTIHNIDNYYDSRYTLITDGWNQEQKTDFKVAQYKNDMNITLQPGTESEKIQLTYTVSRDAIIGLLNEDATLNTAVEIHSYSTKYGEKTICAEGQTGESSNRTGSLYGGYDKDSHPGNANIELRTGDDGIERLYSTDSTGKIIPIKEVEDDTDFAPSFVLTIDRENNKIISGNVWEDSDANPSDSYRLGDGKKSNTEKNVANVKVELYKIKDDGSLELADLYSINENTAEINTKKAEIYTDANGNYSFGDSTFGVITDRYIVKFIYGENIENSKTSSIDNVNISARNYKSTIINANSNLYPIFKGTSNNEEWHLNISKGETIAVDNMEERVVISDLQYDNFNDKINITASSKPFAIQIEANPSESKESNVGIDGKTEFSNKIDVFDFGIVERAREDIFVETTLEYLKITLANGQVLLEGDPRNEALNYTKAMGLNQNITTGEAARNALEKQVLIEVDTELMQSAQLEVKYGLKVTNNSEKDIDYYIEGTTPQYKTEYYYFGTNNENSPEISASVNYVVDYLDSELTYTWENANDWTQKTADELLNEGLISETTYRAIKEQEYTTYITSKFSNLKSGESMQEVIIAKKLLANQDENIYDNHAEILQIDAKTARNQKETGKAKEYKMGNYVPSLVTRQISTDINLEIAGLHEQDDDRIKIAITPPTGETQYITTYVITGLIGLIAVAIMVIFIKKKLVNK